MQNLSISCALVCLIILGSAALLGSFGICQRQISAILITGVMYLLAGKWNKIKKIHNTKLINTQYHSALFAMFTLMIIHVKRNQVRPIIDSEFEGTIEGLVAEKTSTRIVHPLLVARLFTTSWSIDLGWLGVAICTITAAMWIVLSKIMRYNPMSSILS